MPFYMFQGRYTSEAIKSMVASPQDREAAARALTESVGGTLHSFFFCFGNEDILAIAELPDDEHVAALSMVIGASGSFSGGATTKLLTSAQAQSAMTKANAALGSYQPPS